MKTLLIEKGFVVNGKVVEWETFFDVLSYGVSDQKTMEKIKKRIRDVIGYNKISISQNNDLNEVAVILGLKVTNNDRSMRTNILKKIEKLNVD